MQATANKNVVFIPVKKSVEEKSEVKRNKLRVAAYGRVSTFMEHQETSYEAQVEYYTDMIRNNPQWKFAGVYADEGVTGVNTKKRTKFNQMIDDCMHGKIDMIITKSVSRFARNTVDTLHTIRRLKEKGIAVYFETNNINTLEQKGELLITILSSQAQEESRNLSEITHWGMVRSFEKGKMIINYANFMGYTKNEDGELVINETEAEIVRRIFKEYIEGSSTTRIVKGLEEDGVLTKQGKPRWKEATIFSMLSNEKYMGDALLQKTYSKDFLTKKRTKNEGELPQYYIENSHPAIISREIFFKVKAEMLKRSKKKSGSKSSKKTGETGVNKSKYILSGLLVCSECGQPFRRLTWSKNGEKQIVYRCANRAKHGTKYCKNSPTLQEKIIKQTVMYALNRFSTEPAEFNDLLSRNILLAVENDKNIKREEQIKELQQEMAELIKGNTGLSDKGFADRYEELGKEIVRLKEEQKGDEKTEEELNSKMEVISEDLIKGLKNGVTEITEFDTSLVNQVIERIRVINENRIEIEYKSGKIVSERMR